MPEPKERRPVYFAEAGDYVDCPIYDRYALGAGRASRRARPSWRSSTRRPSSTGVRGCGGRDREPDHREGGSVTAEPEERVRLKPHPAHDDSYGIVISRDVMVPMRDGVRLAIDIYRPARDGDFVDGPSRRSCSTPRTTRPTSATRRSPTSSSRAATTSCCTTCATATAPRASGDYYHAATPHTGARRLRHCRVDRRAAVVERPRRHRRQLVRRDQQVRTALEAPPHLTAIWPDVVPTNIFQHQCREGGAMQGHMFWALFIHAQDAQDMRDDPAKTGRRVERPARTCGSSSVRRRGSAGQTALRHVPTLEESLFDYYTRGAYDEYWSRIEHDYTQLLATQHADIPGTFSTGWYDPFPARRHRVLRRDGGEERGAPAARDRARGATSACAATRPTAATSTSGRRASGACSATSRSSSHSSTAGCPTMRPDSRRARRRSASS